MGFNSPSDSYRQAYIDTIKPTSIGLWRGGERSVQAAKARNVNYQQDCLILLNFTIVKTKAVDYKDMATPELEQLLLDYQNEKHAHEERVEWLTQECEEIQELIDERNEDEAE